MTAGQIVLASKTFIPVLIPRSRASRDEETMVAALVAYAAMASGRPRRLGSCCCSIEAKAQFRSTTRVAGSALLRPRSSAPLCREVRLLGDVLGQVLAEYGGAGLLEDVENLRRTVIVARESDDDGAAS